jgi:hypothetical protein
MSEIAIRVENLSKQYPYLNELAGKGILRTEGKGRSVRYILPRVGN